MGRLKHFRLRVLVQFVSLLSLSFVSSAYAAHGACCLNGGVCYDTMNIETCQVWGGVWYPDVTCDDVECETNCGGDCSPGEIQDCFGNCVPITWIGDGICNNGCLGCPQWDTEYIYLNCEEFGYDGGDCPPEDLPQNEGACCIGALDDCDGRYCENKLYADCLAAGGQYLGENTICVDQACSCPPGQTADCNGNCFPIYYLNDGICHDGHLYPESGDDAFEYQLNLSCLELACDVGDCTGICGGACCVGFVCLEDLAFTTCAENGGTFLGGGETCIGVDCESYLVPIAIGVALDGTESPIEGTIGDDVAAKNGIFVLSLVDATDVKTGQSVFACNVYRSSSELSQTMSSPSVESSTHVATDGDRIVLSSGNQLLVYVDDGQTFNFEQTLSVPLTITQSAISGEHLFVATTQPWEGDGVVYWFKRVGSSWNLQDPLDVGSYVQKVVVDGDNLAALTDYVLETFSYDGSTWVNSGSFSLNGSSQDVDIDDDVILLGETTVYSPGMPSLAQATLIEKIGGSWVITEHLAPVDMQPHDEYGYRVSVENGIACVSMPLQDSSVLNGGAIAVFKKIDEAWRYTNRINPINAIPTMGFGSAVATDGASVIACWQAEGEDIWSQGDNGAQFVTLPDFSWRTPKGGVIDEPSNWQPAMPTVGDTASIAIPAKFGIDVPMKLPFSNLEIGTTEVTFSFSQSGNTLPGSLQIAGSPNYTGLFHFGQSDFEVGGDVFLGKPSRRGALHIANGTLFVMGDFIMHKNSQLQVQLGTGSGATPDLSVYGNANINGALVVRSPGPSFSPDIGESWVIFESQQQLSVDDRFDVIVMPGIGSDKYFEIEYRTLLPGTQLVVTVQPVSNLYDLVDSDPVTVSGVATDIVVADIGSMSGPADGFDDIALSVSGNPGSVYVFINDGTGEVSSQITYPAGNNPTSIDAGDIDDDGTLDLVVANADDDEFFLLLNDGGEPSSMSAQLPISTGDYPIDIVMVNIDDDGDNDLVVACFGEEDVLPDGTVPGELRFYEVTPSMRFSVSFVGLLALEKPGTIDPGDVTTDKDFILSITSNSAGKVVAVQSVGGIRGFDWEVTQIISVGANPFDIATGDLDNDGDPDAVVANEGTNTISILRMGSNMEYESEFVIEVGNQPSSVELLDYDGDGDEDLAVIALDANDERVITIYRNDTSLNPGQNITFALEQILDEGLNPILLGSGEMDGDAAEDLVSILSAPAFRGVSESTIAVKSIPSRSTCVGDFDNSMVIDVLDLLSIISFWGSLEGDLNDDGTTDVLDILIVIANWGPCS